MDRADTGRRRRDGRPSSNQWDAHGMIYRKENLEAKEERQPESAKMSPAVQIALVVATLGYIAATIFVKPLLSAGCGVNPRLN